MHRLRPGDPIVVAIVDPLPDDGMELTDKRPVPCCDTPSIVVDRHSPVSLVMRCESCGSQATAREVSVGDLSGKTFQKRRKRLVSAMRQTLETLIERFNYKVITGEEMEEDHGQSLS